MVNFRRYWEAIDHWKQALEITPLNEKIHEMMSQVLMELGEIFPAVEAAEKSIKIKPTWAEAYQTLGRAQLNIGEIEIVRKCTYHVNETYNLQEQCKIIALQLAI